MLQALTRQLIEGGMEREAASRVSSWAIALLTMALCILAGLLLIRLLPRLITPMLSRLSPGIGEIFKKRRVLHRLCELATPLALGLFSENLTALGLWPARILTVWTAVVAIRILLALLDAADDIYQTYEVSKTRPIKGFLQVIKIVAIIVTGIMTAAYLMGQSPVLLLGGLGAMTAVLTLVFKDAILGFVAGIQLIANDMVHIGDWIEMPKYSADGTVTELSLTTVKVENFDRTITNLPAYALISDAFRNWRGMTASGGRRIKRAIHLDTASVTFCTEEQLERFGGIEYLKDYMAERRREIARFNRENGADLSEPVNGRRLTNLGTFRAYIQSYLRRHPGIHRDMTLMVRQLPEEGAGVPLEIYCFTNTTNWVQYETIQADIFDHLLAVAPQFGLRVFQQPSGYDIRLRGE